MAANYSLITADIMDDYSLITAAIMDVPLAQITHDRQYVCFLADNFEFMPSAALRDSDGGSGVPGAGRWVAEPSSQEPPAAQARTSNHG